MRLLCMMAGHKSKTPVFRLVGGTFLRMDPEVVNSVSRNGEDSQPGEKPISCAGLKQSQNNNKINRFMMVTDSRCSSEMRNVFGLVRLLRRSWSMRLLNSLFSRKSLGVFFLAVLLGSLSASAAGPGNPPSITNLTVTGGVAKVRLSGDPNVMYQVQCATSLNGTWQPVEAPNTNNAGASNLVTTSSAFYRVANYTNTTTYQANYSTYSKDKAAPNIVSNLVATVASCSSVNLSWGASVDQGTKQGSTTYTSGLRGYQVYRDNVFLREVTTTSTVDATLVGSHTYAYKVAAVDNAGNRSAFSSTVNATTPSCISCSYSIASNSASYSSSSVTRSLPVTATSGCTWTATNNGTSWITITSGSSGAGNGTINFTVAANTSSTARNASMTVAGLAFSITQAGAPCTYSLSPVSTSMTASGGSGNVSVTAIAGCAWSATANDAWITITSGGSGSGNGTVSYSVAANGSSSSRSGTLTIGGQTFTVNQSGVAACSYSVSPTSSSFAYSGGSGSSIVTTGSGCTWTATSAYSWITITSGGSGTGGGTVAYTVAANGTAATRAGTVVVHGGGTDYTITVNQDAAPTCTYSVTPNNVYASSAASTSGASSLTAGSGCSWTLSSSAAWLTITSPTSGSGNTTIAYSLAANAALTGRAAVITVTGQNTNRTITVNQDGNLIPVANAGGNVSVPVSTSVVMDGSGSTDDDGTIVNYQWNYGDSGTGSGVTSQHSYAAAGNYTVTLTTTDDLGASASASKQVTVTNNSTATPGQAQWVRNMISGYRLLPAGVVADHANNVISVGTFMDAAGASSDFGGGPMANAAGWTGFIAKYSAQNAFLWVKVLAGGVASVAVDGQNNIIATGYFQGSVDFGGVTLTSTLNPLGAYSSDIFIVKYSPSGGLLWAKKFGGSGNDSGTAVAVDGSGNIFMAAQFSSVSIDLGTGLLYSVGDFDMALVKLSGATGATTWAKTWGSTGYDIPNGVAVDGAGDVLLTGSASGAINLGGGSIGTGGAVVAKYAGADGTHRWSKALGGTAGFGIAADPITSKVFVTGSSGGFFLNAYDSSGNLLWSKSNGGSGDEGRAVTVDASGNVAMTGHSSQMLDFGDGIYVGGGYFFVANYTTTGTFRWAKRANTNTGTGIAFDSLGHVLTTGSFGGSLALTVDFGGVFASVGMGVTDGFVVEYTK
ncbi:MAG: PKD domain-containing protein [Verrucomicrobia bacterium]|nr:MAG: PKD domain-containing protein [Verrucomicrobiota bacterium]